MTKRKVAAQSSSDGVETTMQSTDAEIFNRISQINVSADWIQIREDLDNILKVDYNNPLAVAEKLANAPRMKNFFGQARITIKEMIAKKQEQYSHWYAEKLNQLPDKMDKGTQKERERIIKQKNLVEYEEKFAILSDLEVYEQRLTLAEECMRYQERALNAVAGMMWGTLRDKETPPTGRHDFANDDGI
jgi:hypothetical protein